MLEDQFFQLAVQNKIPSPFSIAKEAAGKIGSNVV
jgi:hypothetical protein